MTHFKIFLSTLFGLICFFVSYIVFLPYLLISGKFAIHYQRTMDGIFHIMDWVLEE